MKKIFIPDNLKKGTEQNIPYLIAIEGPNGVGKSTLCRKIAKKLNTGHCLSTPSEWMNYEIKKRMIFKASWIASAFYFFSGAMEMKRELSSKFIDCDIVIMDRSFWSTLAVNWIQDINRIDFLLSIASEGSEFLPIPNNIIILTADYEVCEERIRSKNDKGKELDQISKDNFLKEIIFYDWLDKHLENVIKIDTSNSNEEDIFNEVYSIINEKIISLS